MEGLGSERPPFDVTCIVISWSVLVDWLCGWRRPPAHKAPTLPSMSGRVALAHDRLRRGGVVLADAPPGRALIMIVAEVVTSEFGPSVSGTCRRPSRREGSGKQTP
jgi:hypothetical protein